MGKRRVDDPVSPAGNQPDRTATPKGQWREVLELAKTLGNVSEACRRTGRDRTSFYKWKKRVEQEGFDRAFDSSRRRKHPATLPQTTVEAVLETAGEHPGWGCGKISAHLRVEGRAISSPTVQKILIRNHRASRRERAAQLEQAYLQGGLTLSEEQIKLIEKINPAFKERQAENFSPGQLLCQDTFLIGRCNGNIRVYLHCLVDTCGSYAFGYCCSSRSSAAARGLLQHFVFPRYRDWGQPIQTILTSSAHQFGRKKDNIYTKYVLYKGAEHQKTPRGQPLTNGFMQLFYRTLKEKFVSRVAPLHLRSVDDWQYHLETWLDLYNVEQHFQGYPNQGRTPKEFMNSHGNLQNLKNKLSP